MRACCVVGSASEVALRAIEGSPAGGAAPGFFFEFKRANYPEKQSGTSWQEI